MKTVLIGILLLFNISLAFASPQLSDELEARAKDVGHALRCVVCQNQSIEESEASLAEDMRRLVRSRIKAGDTNDEVITFMRERYGDYVLLKPPVNKQTYVLWFAPFALVLACLVWYVSRGRHTTGETVASLSAEERETLERLLKDNHPS